MSARSRRLVLSARARVDLSDILLYTEQRWGRKQMRAYNRILTEAFAELARFPHLEQGFLTSGDRAPTTDETSAVIQYGNTSSSTR